MVENKKIVIEELAKFGLITTVNEQAKSLINQQNSTWELAANNYSALKRIQTKTFDFGHFKILAQFNAERIRSSAAKTDAKSIAERPCFLCLENLPEIQKGIVIQNKYLLLVNPFPIFSKHFTISEINHKPQQIKNHFADLLELSSVLPDFTVFYNGPKCGASAPDHFHFQAGEKGLLPIEAEFENLSSENSEVLIQTEKIKVVAVENFSRRFIGFVSADKNQILDIFKKIYSGLESGQNEEPMMNILCNSENGIWRVILFPRQKQRPSHFFRTNEKQIMISPAAVELGGLLVLPREEDFNKITKKEIEEIYGEVTIDSATFKKLIKKLKEKAE